MKTAECQTLDCALGLFQPRRSKLGASRDPNIITHAFGSVGGNREMDFPALARQFRKERADDPLVIRMGKDGENRPPGLGGFGRPKRRCSSNQKQTNFHAGKISPLATTFHPKRTLNNVPNEAV